MYDAPTDEALCGRIIAFYPESLLHHETHFEPGAGSLVSDAEISSRTSCPSCLLPRTYVTSPLTPFGFRSLFGCFTFRRGFLTLLRRLWNRGSAGISDRVHQLGGLIGQKVQVRHQVGMLVEEHRPFDRAERTVDSIQDLDLWRLVGEIGELQQLLRWRRSAAHRRHRPHRGRGTTRWWSLHGRHRAWRCAWYSGSRTPGRRTART
jgi:hypothetical protein